MSNPNPVKQVRNAGETLSASEKARRIKHMPRVRLAGEAMPFSVSIFGKDNVYRPKTHAVARPGADDHLAIPSRSFAGVRYPAQKREHSCLALGVCQGKDCLVCKRTTTCGIVL